jgi:hypothetical protein
MGSSCSIQRGDKCLKVFVKERDKLGNIHIGVGGKTVLKWDLEKKFNERVRAGFLWLRLGTSGRYCCR